MCDVTLNRCIVVYSVGIKKVPLMLITLWNRNITKPHVAYNNEN